MNEPLFQKLSMARRAGKLVCGFDRVKDSVSAEKGALVLTASDLSPKTLKELHFFCKDKIAVIATKYTMEQFGESIGFRTGIVSVEDRGFASAIQKILNTEG